ncbi:MAG: 50S ribosomal protein L13 [Coriobacteriia bacterium]|nr:50S ribosomal protein L13 [Coriobacteriia bacterium]
MKTYYAKKEDIKHEWYLIDATDLVLGRLASFSANILRGKNKPEYTPHVDTGDNLIIINADKIKVTGAKAIDKEYKHHSGHPGGMKSESYALAMEKHPERVVEHAIKGMLPKNTLGRQMGMKLHVYAGDQHKHQAQKPQEIKVEG